MLFAMMGALAVNATATDTPTFLLSIAAIIVAALSPVSVVLVIFLTDWLKSRRERESTKSLVVAYLNRISDQLPSIMAFLTFLAGALPIDEKDLPTIEWSVKNVRPLDNEIYRKEISRKLLRVDSNFAKDLLLFNAHIEGFNDFLPKVTDLLTDQVTQFPDAQTRAFAISGYLTARSRMLKKWKEYLEILEALVIDWKMSLLERKRYQVSFDKLAAKNQEVLKSFFEPEFGNQAESSNRT